MIAQETALTLRFIYQTLASLKRAPAINHDVTRAVNQQTRDVSGFVTIDVMRINYYRSDARAVDVFQCRFSDTK